MKIPFAILSLCSVLFLCSCTSDGGEPEALAKEAVNPVLAQGTVTGVSPEFGNAYTSIEPAKYESLGLTPGKVVELKLSDESVVMTVGESYEAVPTNAAVAVLHEEGLTLAIRDGNFTELYDVSVGDAFVIVAVK